MLHASHKWTWRHGLLLLVIILFLVRWMPHQKLIDSVPSSTAIMAADGSLMRLTLAEDEQYRLWTVYRDIAPAMPEAVLLQEDQWFYWHPGFNPISLIRGAWETYTGRSQQGGSTITMQLARLHYQLDTRKPLGKARQILLAIWLELRFGKREILEAYLNLAPYGHNIQGVAAASLIYFDKTADQLNLPEILSLAVIPQKPNQRGVESPGLQQARMRLLKRWQAKHPVSAAEIQLASLPMPLRSPRKLPFTAPHFTDQLLYSAYQSPHQQIQTTLQPALQRMLEQQVSQYVRQHQIRGINNASALLVHVRSREVVAMVGSADYHNAEIQGQVNGTLAKRSPGSTLKPFIYGLAFDQGVIHPHSILRDAPTAFGPFQPENFDGQFTGPIPAYQALNRSRNIPAVDIASRLQQPSLHGFLKTAGISKLLSEQHYGLALVLGGGEVSMEELATLYVMLGNQGNLQPLRYTKQQSEVKSIPLLSPEASFMVRDILHANPRPDGISAAQRHPWHIAWKTGTSWGFRDAWTAGIVGPYVLVIWIGHFDGSPNPAFIGIEAAAPLFFRVADAVPMVSSNAQDLLHLPTQNLKRVKVCAASGDLPNRWCPKLEETWFIPGKSPIKVSTLHRPVMIDKRSGQVACPPYDPNNTYEEIHEFWDSSMLRLFREAGMPRRTPPKALCNDTRHETQQDIPVITSPLRAVAYQIRLSHPEETIALQATAAADAQQLYWFSGNRFLGSAASQGGGLPWRPDTSGWHHLSVVDDQGRRHQRSVKIDILP
jgi:penicillin-binding protein 1C